MHLFPLIPMGFLVITCGIAGFIIARKAEEELRPGRKWFLIVQKAILAIVSVLISFTIPWPYSIPAFIGLIGTLLLFQKEYFSFILLGAGIAIASTKGTFPYVTALAILYALTSAALMHEFMMAEKIPPKRIAILTAYLYLVFLIPSVMSLFLG